MCLTTSSRRLPRAVARILSAHSKISGMMICRFPACGISSARFKSFLESQKQKAPVWQGLIVYEGLLAFRFFIAFPMIQEVYRR